MNEGIYLALGLSLFSRLHQGKKRRKRTEFVRETVTLALTLIVVASADFLFTTFLWNPAGRTELRWISLLLWALLVSGGSEEGFLPVAGISLWMAAHEPSLSGGGRLAAGVGLAVLTEGFKAFLAGVEERLRLSEIPKIFEELPMFLLTAAIGALVFQGILGLLAPSLARPF